MKLDVGHGSPDAITYSTSRLSDRGSSFSRPPARTRRANPWSWSLPWRTFLQAALARARDAHCVGGRPCCCPLGLREVVRLCQAALSVPFDGTET